MIIQGYSDAEDAAAAARDDDDDDDESELGEKEDCNYIKIRMTSQQ